MFFLFAFLLSVFVIVHWVNTGYITPYKSFGITSLMILREPAAQSSKNIFNVLNSFATGIIQLHKSEDNGEQQPGIIDITPNIGHTEGKFKANYFIEPYKKTPGHNT